MKILHVCLAAFYIDDFGYQENILPKMHKLQGHDVAILASTETFIDTKLGYTQSGSYLSSDGIPVTRIPYIKWLPHKIVKKLRIYTGVSECLNKFKPDIIFLHDCQFLSISQVAKYAKKNKDTIIFVDGHTDFINSARTWISKNILHKVIYKWCAQKIEPFTTKFYGTLPLRVDFFIDVYKIPAEKTELLMLGIDDTKVDYSNRAIIGSKIREELGIKNDDFVVVTGGKIDSLKNIHLLMKAIKEIDNPKIHLIVFGKVAPEMQNEINELLVSQQIHFVGWIPAAKSVDYFFASDIAFFPGTHSVLWEESVGLGVPGVFKRWKGIEHIDLKGNCIFLDTVDVLEIKNAILYLYNNPEILIKMKAKAIDEGIKQFSYYEIAKKAIELN